jgi:hypothetical protein
MVAQNRSGSLKNEALKGQGFCVLTKSKMKHVGMNIHSGYQRKDIKSYRGLYCVNKGTYHWVYKTKFVEQAQRKLKQVKRNKQRKVYSQKKKNEPNFKQKKAQKGKRSSGFNHKKSQCCVKPKTYHVKGNDKANSDLRNQLQNQMAYLNCN